MPSIELNYTARFICPMARRLSAPLLFSQSESFDVSECFHLETFRSTKLPGDCPCRIKSGLITETKMLLLKLSKIERTDHRADRYVDQDDEGDRAVTRAVEQTRAVFVAIDKIRN